MDVQIYTTPTCGYCVQAKNWFNEHGIEYVEHTMNTEAEKLDFYQRINNTQEQLQKSELSKQQIRQVASVPQIFVNGERIGGYAGLLENSEKILKKRGGSLTRFSEGLYASLNLVKLTTLFFKIFSEFFNNSAYSPIRSPLTKLCGTEATWIISCLDISLFCR